MTFSQSPIQRIRQLAVHLEENHPCLRKPIELTWNTYEQVVFQASISWNRLQYREKEAKIQPRRLLRIDSSQIDYYLGSHFDFLADSGRVIGGEWDRNKTSFEETTFHQSFVEHFQEEVPWKKTKLYKRGIEAIEKGEYSRNRSVEAFEVRLSRFDMIFEQIANEGYRTQRELIQSELDPTRSVATTGLIPYVDTDVIRHEIAVNIGREGRFFVNDGRHRVSMAKILDIKNLPIRIIVRHKEWQELRKEVARTIEAAIASGVASDDIRTQVEDSLHEELEDVFLGLDHPDLHILFERRLAEA